MPDPKCQTRLVIATEPANRQLFGPPAWRTGCKGSVIALARHRPMNVPRKTPGRSLLWFLPGAAVFLLGVLFTPAGASRFISGDVTVYLLNAARMLEGQAIYKDFFQYTTPGTELVYLSLFKAFGARAWVPNLVVILLGSG